MNKQQLNELLNKSTPLTSSDLELLEETVQVYPYFQIAHTLIAKVHHELQTAAASQKLSTAAIRVLNRGRLKEIIETDTFFESNFSTVSSSNDIGEEQNHPDQQDDFLTETPNSVEEPETTSSVKPEGKEEIYQEIEQNIRNLQLTREKLGLNEPSEQEPTSTNEPDSFTSEPTAEQPASEEPKNLETVEYIEEIAKREEKQITAVQKQQQEIIDNFIANAPKIQRMKLQAEPEDKQEDLSKKHGELNNELLTENLASIMAKQGKTQKAIDIYQKLIWKNPEKKAYFVSCIENLKNQ